MKVTRYVINNVSSHTKTEKKVSYDVHAACFMIKKWVLYDEKNVSHKESYTT